MYRIPMMLELPQFITRHSKQNLNCDVSTTTAKTITGVIIAGIEVVVVTPTERLKVWLMTKEASHKNIRYFFKNSHKLFRGLELVFWKQIVSWVTFLGTDEFMKKQFRKQKNLSDH